MPPRKYDDFVISEPVSKITKLSPTSADDVRDYVFVRCPHCNVNFVEIAVQNLATKKAGECLKHIRECSAAKQAGITALPAKKRASGVSDASPGEERALKLARTDLESERQRSAVSAASETSLTTKNDQLTGRVHSLEEQAAELRRRDGERERQMAEMRDTIFQMQGQFNSFAQGIANALNITFPPAPQVDHCVERIKGLQQALAVAGSMGGHPDQSRTIARLRAERNELKEHKEALRSLMCDDRAFKLASVFLHPDKRSELPAAARDAAALLFDAALDARRKKKPTDRAL